MVFDPRVDTYIKEAVQLNASGVKPVRGATKPALKTPTDLLAALKGNQPAKTTFDGFSPSRKREYIEWITEAKREATRTRRVAQAVEWLAEGKPRNWQYMKKW